MTRSGFDGRTLADAAPVDAPAPPPDARLLAAIRDMKPVRTRSRFGGFALVLAVGLVLPVLTLLRSGARQDLAALPRGWLVGGVALWALAFVGALAAALIPRRGDVLPSASLASRVGVASIVALLAFSLAAARDGAVLRPEDVGKSLLGSCVACGRYVLEVAIVLLAAGALVLRRVLPVGGRRIGMALGAAGGAAGGLALYLHCPIGTAAHVAISHVGPVLVAALAGALLLPR